MNDTIDLLQLKIDKARAQLPKETIKAIDAVPWKITLLEMRQKKGYSIEQLGDLELETELLLCGLLSPDDYPTELEARLKIPKAQVDVLVNEMNDLVFKKIRDELVKNSGKGKVVEHSPGISRTIPTESQPKVTTPVSEMQIKKADTHVLGTAGIKVVQTPVNDPEAEAVGLSKIESRQEMLDKVENPRPIKMPEMFAQKLSDSFQIKAVKTEHSLNNISRTDAPVPPTPTSYKEKEDPYRIHPEE